MKKHWILLLLALCVTVGSASAGIRRIKRPPPPTRPVPVRDCMAELDLTQRQIDAIVAIRRAAMEALKQAETPEEARAIIEQMRQDIEGVLTEDQLAALRECRRPKRPLTCWDRLDLTPEQIEEMHAIRAAAREALRQAQSPEEACAIIEQMHQDLEAVLTEEQLAALRQCLRPREPVNCMEQIGLTEEQVALMDEIRAAAADLLATAETREEVRAIMDQMYDDLMAVLTERQLAALQDCRDTQRLQHDR